VDEAVAGAAARLRAGGVVVFPTESVYGLGADASDAAAVARLVAVRGRDADKPILVLVRDLAMAEALSAEFPPLARRLAARFWPGPLTLVVPARPGLPAPLTAGTGTIGLRVPGHPLALALVRALGRPVTAPSANPPGGTPPDTVAAARAYFGDAVDAYLDGGTLAGGASTVVAVDGERMRVVRDGLVSHAALDAALAEAAAEG
jgi:L-threonylcarbamoyladenylate synthase